SISSREFVRAARQQGTPVYSLPKDLAKGAEFTPALIESIARQAVAALRTQTRVILTIGLPPVKERDRAGLFAVYLVQLAEAVLSQAKVENVYAEGGATAVELVRRMSWSRLSVLRELAPGVASLVIADKPGLVLTIKPGTYLWPD